MTKSTLLIFLFFALTLNAQKKSDTTSIQNKKVWPFSIDIMYGQSIFFKNFYNQLNSFEKLNINLPIRQFGIGYSNYDRHFGPGNNLTIRSQASFNYFMTNNLIFNDTTKSEIKGFSVSYSIGKNFFKKSKYFRFNTYFGFNTGRTVLTKQDNLNLKNPFFAPKILLQPKVIIKRLCFSLFLDYCYDISNKNWKKLNKSNTQYYLDKFDQSKLTFMFSIGYRPV